MPRVEEERAVERMDAAEDEQLVERSASGVGGDGLVGEPASDEPAASAAGLAGRPGRVTAGSSRGCQRDGAGGSGASVSSHPRRGHCFSPALIRGSSISRLRTTLRIRSTSGDIFSKYASSRHGSGPLL